MAYLPPHHRYPAGTETPRTLLDLSNGLLERVYTVEYIRRIR